jgi:tRNA pseudouridine55 synthase
VIESRDTSSVTDQAITEVLTGFIGKISQVPSSVSAIKVAGKRAYDLVRAGEEVELKAREIEIFTLQILDIRRGQHLDIDIEVACSAGTYIRSIARDLGAALEVGGHLIELRRTEVAPFGINQAKSIEDSVILPLHEEIAKILPTRTLNEEEVTSIRFGRKITPSNFSEAGVALDRSGQVVAIIENRDYGAQPLTVLNP